MNPIWENLETDFSVIFDELIWTAQCGTNVDDNIQKNASNTMFRTNVVEGSYWEGITTSNRSEMSSHNGPAFASTDELWIAYAMKVDPDSGPITGDAYLGQLHDIPGGGDAPADPPMAFQLNNRTFALKLRSNTTVPLPVNPKAVTPWQIPITYGVWYQFVINMQMDPFGNGFFKLWINSELVLNWTGAFGYASISECYWKFGIYDAPPQDYYRGVWWANVEAGTTSLLARVDDPLPLPDGAEAITLLPYDEVNPSQVFGPGKTIYNFPVALMNNFIERLNERLQRIEDDITDNYEIMINNYAFAADAFLLRIPEQDAVHEAAYRELINGLVVDGVWGELDALWIFKAAQIEAAVANLKSPNFLITLASNYGGGGAVPTFVEDGYFEGDGVEAYLNTGFNPVEQASAKFQLNSASIGFWIESAGQFNCGAGYTHTGTGESYLIPRYTDDKAYLTINQNTEISVASTDGLGFWLGSRTASNVLSLDHDGAKVLSGVTASSQVLDEFFTIFYGAGYYSGKVSAAVLGGGLSDAQMVALYDRIAAYMAAIP
jgi:hypothetical protein